MQRILLPFFLILFSVSMATGQNIRTAEPIGSAPSDKQVVQGLFTPKKNCTSCSIKVIRQNNRPAIEVSLGCSKQPRNIKINGTVVPANHYSGSTYIAVLQNAPRGSYHVSVKSQWVALGAYYAEGGTNVCVPNDVSGSAAFVENLPQYCSSTPINIRSGFRNGTTTNYRFQEVLPGGRHPQIGNQILRNGNPPSQFNLMEIFRAENGRHLPPGNYRAIISVSNSVSDKQTTLNFTIRESSRDNPCDIMTNDRMEARRLGGL
ncbi:hypothetical protein [Neolewinella agarilytica]|uniref:Uncharacterized protein n=1 Tax=Neolewinella agarilytica TaxID=478744 RepID=A0A1H9N6P7_9BACT|nr:hypothetical protein [Neolewinella agarilytica]SER31710.1 hypothetical protein SAMN05444359_13430 [Neolewinella agarilytica]